MAGTSSLSVAARAQASAATADSSRGSRPAVCLAASSSTPGFPLAAAPPSLLSSSCRRWSSVGASRWISWVKHLRRDAGMSSTASAHATSTKGLRLPARAPPPCPGGSPRSPRQPSSMHSDRRLAALAVKETESCDPASRIQEAAALAQNFPPMAFFAAPQATGPHLLRAFRIAAAIAPAADTLLPRRKPSADPPEPACRMSLEA